MTITQPKPPSLLKRIGYVFRPSATDDPRRIIHNNPDGTFDRYSNDLASPGFAGTAAQRRAFRTEADYPAILGAVYAAVRRRVRMVQKAKIVLVRRVGSELVEEPDDHPAFQPLHRVNESLTERQGRGLIEQHKLTAGKAYWIKRRNQLRTATGARQPVEFEIWDPRRVEVVPRKDKAWVPAAFRLHEGLGKVTSVAPEDVVWFRHMIDPRNPLNGLGPIGAVRVELDTGLEAQRFNAAFFDNDAHPGMWVSVEEGGPAEVARIEDQLRRAHQGSDNMGRTIVTEGDVKEVGSSSITHKDMQFLEQKRWTVQEVARVFELSPLALGEFEHATFSNVEGADAQDWQAIVDQVDSTIAEWNEFYLWPDFGEEFSFIARFPDIAALQEDQKTKAQVDEINLRSGKAFINELRDRDGEEPVEWGDVPLMPRIMAPLGSGVEVAPPAEDDEAAEGRHLRAAGVQEAPAVEDAEEAMQTGWRRRLRDEMQAMVAHLEAADARALRVEDVALFDWDWEARYGTAVAREIEIAYLAELAARGFVDTAILPGQQLAANYARARAGEMLVLSGRDSIIEFTRARMARLVAETIEKGESLRTLKNRIRKDFAFSDSRAEMIARTETATAQGEAQVKSYQSLGHEGKEWQTALDERVDGGDPSGPCNANEAQGPVRLGEAFQSGHDTVPAHPRCRCTTLPVVEMPRE